MRRTILSATRLLAVLAAWFLAGTLPAQETPAEPPPEQAPGPRPLPAGVEVQTRGPIHEAFASPTTEPQPTPLIPRQPPKPIEELPPEQKPEGAVVWISGYWGWDDERKDFLWISGTWRVPPPGKTWISGYWREENSQWRWVPGFWTAANPERTPRK